MKAAIIKAVSDWIVIEEDEPVDINLTTDDDAGAIFAVAIPGAVSMLPPPLLRSSDSRRLRWTISAAREDGRG